MIQSKEYKPAWSHFNGFVFFSRQGGRKMTTSPSIPCATTQLASCTASSWRITTTAGVRWKKSKAWAPCSSCAPAPRRSATRTSSLTPVSSSHVKGRMASSTSRYEATWTLCFWTHHFPECNPELSEKTSGSLDSWKHHNNHYNNKLYSCCSFQRGSRSHFCTVIHWKLSKRTIS